MSTRREQRQSYEPPPSSEVSVECESELTVFKVLIIGDTNVGKTALLRRFCDGDYPTTFISTVGEWRRLAQWESRELWCRVWLSDDMDILSFWSKYNLFNSGEAPVISVCVCVCVCAGIDYKTRVISLDEESVKLQIW